MFQVDVIRWSLWCVGMTDTNSSLNWFVTRLDLHLGLLSDCPIVEILIARTALLR